MSRSASQARRRFLARRAAFALFLVFAVSSIAMVLARLAPGDATAEMLLEGASTRTIAREREGLGLERGVGASYVRWLAGAVRLDFGRSFRYQRPVGPFVLERARNTALLAVCALVVATVVGLPVGIAVAGASRRWTGPVRMLSVTALSMPPFVLSILLAWVAARTGWLPVGGMTSDAHASASGGAVLDVARHLVVPVLALAVPLAATLERLQARAMADALGDPWIAAARARGIPDGRLRWRHALRRALLPVSALYGLIAGALLSGSFAVEVVTAWPGLGRLMYEALLARDVNLVAGCAAAGAAFVAAGTFVADVAASWLDPRIAEGQ